MMQKRALKQKKTVEALFDHIDQTTESLAIMVAKGFEDLRNELRGEIGGLRTELKEDIQGIHIQLSIMNDRFIPWYAFDKLSARVDKIEKKR